MTNTIRFDDGAAYERYMGVWSRLVGEVFLSWLAPPTGLRCLDVGCGNGAFTEMLLNHCAPTQVTGIDPSAAQLAYAQTQAQLNNVQFQQADAMALPFAEAQFDLAVMPLVIFFVPEPAQGVAEMARVVAQGGTVAAYAWDMLGGGFPYASLQAEIRRLGFNLPAPPSVDAAQMTTLIALWQNAGLHDIQTREIVVERCFASFDDYWQIILGGPSVAATLASMDAETISQLQSLMRQRLPTDEHGHIRYSARANAISGKK